MNARIYKLATEALAAKNLNPPPTDAEIDAYAAGIQETEADEARYEKAMQELADTQQGMFRTIRRLEPAAARIESDAYAQSTSTDEDAEQETAWVWIDQATGWHFTEGKDGFYYTIAFNEDEKHRTPDQAIEWLKGRYSA